MNKKCIEEENARIEHWAEQVRWFIVEKEREAGTP